ncbi:uncharacterized protein LOC105663301 [Megachile rotundata]|uniref:uncharacterized protein LOC105663301 n=1 Tax=Megachile rotundata TaxID=143995 RepID=UPI0006153E2B|nr:PREDICTED: uncharacterized protein LOC105663301 [Megachile rotundata]
MVERLHRQLKGAIKCHDTDNWVETLPIVLLGIRATMKEDLKATAAEMLYGTKIRLPADFFVPTNQEANSSFVKRLKDRIKDIKPRPASCHNNKTTFIFKELAESPYVFLRYEAVKSLLQPPYDGPYEVIERGEKNFTIRINDKNVKVSIDRLKPAFLISGELESESDNSEEGTELHVQTRTERNVSQRDDNSNRFTTRSGRVVRFPVRFQAGLN